MPRKITNYLSEGLPSRIYLLCFIAPRSGYQLALDTSGKLFTSKIYGWTKKMVEAGVLELDPYGYRAPIKPLVLEVERALKDRGETLSQSESKLLTSILASESFKKGISNSFESWKDKTPNIVYLSLDFLSVICALTLNIKTLYGVEDSTVDRALKRISEQDDESKKQLTEMEPFFERMGQRMSSHLEKLGMTKRGTVEEPDDAEHLVKYAFFYELPYTFLKKMAKLAHNAQMTNYVFALVTSMNQMFGEILIEQIRQEQERKKKKA